MSKDILDQISKARQIIMKAHLDYHQISLIEDEADRQKAYADYAHLTDAKLIQLGTELEHASHWLGRDIRNQQERLKQNPSQFVGPVNFSSGKVIVSDPCYEVDNGGNHTLENVKNGLWLTTKTVSDEGDWGFRTAAIEAYIDEAPKEHEYQLEFNADVDVDSGQAGFFDLSGYRNISLFTGTLPPIYPGFGPKDGLSPEERNAELFYGICANITLRNKTGVLPYGIVSDTGYGDGSYDLFLRRDEKGLVTAMKLVFIDEEEEEEEEDYDEEEEE